MSIVDIEVRTGDSMAGPGDERPLTDEERKLVSRLFADPIAFPQTFKTWLVAFLEGSDLTLPMNSILGLTSILSPGSGVAGIMGALPAGLIFPSAGVNPPGGTLLCDGRLVSKNTYPRLWKAIQSQWGPADPGETGNFSLPDIQGRMVIGTGPGHGANENDNRAAINRGPKHHHYVSLGNWSGDDNPNHTHAQPGGGRSVPDGGGFTTIDLDGGGWPSTYGINNSHQHYTAIQGDTSGGGDQDQPAFIAIPYVINY